MCWKWASRSEPITVGREVVNDLLADFESDISRDNLRRLLHYSRRIAGFQSRAKYVLGSIEEVLESGTQSLALCVTVLQLTLGWTE